MFPKYELRSSSISILNINPFGDCPARFHKQVEIGFVTEGELKLSVEDKTYRLKKNDLYIAFPNLVHATYRSSGKGVVLIADSSLFPSFHQKLTRLQPSEPILRSSSLPPILPNLFLRLSELSREEETAPYQPLFTGYINAVLGEIFLKLECRERSSDSNLLQNLMTYLLNSYTNDITLEHLAKELNYSKWYLSKVIANTFHCNFRSLINSYRIGMAQNLLLSSQMTVSEIAFECGFKNQSSFNRIFLEATKQTPTEFRKLGGSPVEKPEVFYR